MIRWLSTCGTRGPTRVIWILVFALICTAPGYAQSIWELTPYKVKTWVVLESRPLIPPTAAAQLDRQLRRSADSSLGAVWDLQIEEGPVEYRGEFFALQEPSPDSVLTQFPAVEGFDKLMVVVVVCDDNGYRVDVAELDVRTRVWSAWASRHVDTWARVADVTFRLMCETFVPLAQIRRVEDDQVTAYVRAGALLRPESSARRWNVPTEITTGDILQPVIRRADRNGKVNSDGVKPIQWTVLLVEEQDGGELICKTLSGYKQPFNVRRSARVEQLALLIRPKYDTTTLRLTDRRNPEQPLVGYDIYSRRPGVEVSEFIGRTDWRGLLQIDPDEESPVRVLYVKNGSRLLGKLPVIPGQMLELTAPIRNDDGRLEAEGVVLGLKENLIDLVARREVLSSRIRARIEDGKLDEAEELIGELGRLETKDEFNSRIDRRIRNSRDDVRQMINAFKVESRALLDRYLDPSRVRELQSRLEEARASAGNG